MTVQGGESVEGGPFEPAEVVASDEVTEPAAEPPAPVSRRARVIFVATVAAAVAALLVIHGELPGLVSSVEWFLSAQGYMECGALSLRALAEATCPLTGGVAGGSVANGIAFIVPGALLVRIGVAPWLAYVITSAAYLTVALLGAYALGRLVGLRRWFAFGAAMAYLVMPSLLGMHGLGPTFIGVALMPAAVVAGLWCGDRVTGVDRRSVLAASAWFGSALVMLLLDGYGYAMAQAVVGLVTLAQALRHPRVLRGWVTLVVLGAVNLLAVVVHRVILPDSGEWTRSPIDLFRAMGADLVTLVAPSDWQWWGDLAPWRVDPAVMWGDGTNSRFNYLGVLLVALAVIAVVKYRRHPWVLPLAVVAVATLVMSFGPSLKVDEVRGPLQVPVTFESYLMPAEDAVVTLPTEVLYEKVPGLGSMRATYRWITATRLAVILLAALGAQHLWSHARTTRGRAAVAVVCALAVLEVAPDPGTLVTRYDTRGDVAAGIDEDVIEPMREAIEPGSTIVLGPSGDGGSNHFLASYLAPRLRAHMFNVGGDKALEVARASWPQDVAALIEGTGDFDELAEDLLDEGVVDAVVVPFFDLRWSLTAWPTSETFAEPGRAAVAEALQNDDLRVDVYEYFAVITLAEDAGTLD